MEENTGLVKAVIEAATEIDGRKKLACAQAFRIAESFGVGVAQVGRICDENDIKIYGCQLGCFK